MVGGVVDLKIGDHPNIAGMRRADELTEIVERAIIWMNVAIATNIVAVVKQRRGIERQHPYSVHPEVGYVIEF